jgi:hypothetical protein
VGHRPSWATGLPQRGSLRSNHLRLRLPFVFIIEYKGSNHAASGSNSSLFLACVDPFGSFEGSRNHHARPINGEWWNWTMRGIE